MSLSTKNVVPLSQARARFSELANEVKSGTEKVITKNGKSYVALIDAARLEHYHGLERAHIQLALLDEVEKGLADVRVARTSDARAVLRRLRRKRSR